MTCARPVPLETWVAYFARDLGSEEEQSVEEHLLGCQACSREAGRVAALTETIRASIPPLLHPLQLARLVAKGLRHLVNPMLPGERKEVRFPGDVDLLVHRLGGLDLRDAARVDFTLRPEGSERVLLRVQDAPFDRDAGAILVACQRHYAAFPHDTVATVTVTERGGAERATEYTILHQFE